MTFRDLNLNTPLLNALDDLGYKEPTSIQHKVFAEVMSGKDILGIAQTGTGKTFAYLLPMLRSWQYTKEKHPQIVILVPTRELVVQVIRQIEKLTAYMNVRCVGVYGGTNIHTQSIAVREGLDIVVGTPGRLMDLALNGSLKLKFVKKLVIDEIDEMMELGFRVQLINIFDLLPPKRQNLLFSATLNPIVENILQDFFNNPLKIEAAPMGTPLKNIKQFRYNVPNFNTKLNLLEYLLLHDTSMKRVLVFAETKALADMIFEEIDRRLPDSAKVIHSNKSQNYRFESIRSFQSGEVSVLIATDIIARGIDIFDVSHVVNFDIPEEAENYIHRIGRTGRADKDGISISFVSEKEEDAAVAIEVLMKYEVPQLEFPTDVKVSEELIMLEKEVIFVPNVSIKLKISEGAAFQEKSAKRLKVNAKIRRNEKMMNKYGKTITRGDKIKNNSKKKRK
jgi:ATP-dependent RNA helicase RhlE